MKPFDSDAQARVASLFRTLPPEQFLSELETYAPRIAPEHAAFQMYYGWALYDAGWYHKSRPYLTRALRGSDRGSRHRSITYGLLAESYFRVGQLDRAERCTRRALYEGCERDPDNFVQAGHLQVLGRIQAHLGHLTHTLDTCTRALALINESSPHWLNLLLSISQVHLYRGDLHEADAAILEARRGDGGCKQQEWGIGEAECPIAIALGDIERADGVISEMERRYFAKSGERVKHLLTEMRALVLNAHGRYRESEDLLRGILARAVLGSANADAVASASRTLTESLMGQARYAEALETCEVAIRAGSHDDRAEWVTALRLKGECLLALGATAAARRVFREAMSVHAMTQFDAERALVERSLRRAGFRESVAFSGPQESTRSNRGIERLSLRSGRAFVSGDARLVESIRAASRTDLPVLIEGETGTGKEVIANLIHELGPTSGGPFVVVDCTSLPESLADSELFGAARGSYTGAFRERAGLLAQADGGTLLLDELPELTTSLQAKLLRVVQEGTYRRLGEDRPRRVRVRFVATTNRNVKQLLDSGALKADLFYRLSGHRITTRPLRSRKEEIGHLAVDFAKRSGLAGVQGDAIQLLESQPWPGNVRQLEMIVRLAAASCRIGAMLGRAHLEPHILGLEESDMGSLFEVPATLRANRLAAERAVLERTLLESGGVVADAARSLGISRQSFYQAMHRTKLAPPRSR